MSYSTILYETKGPVALITLNRPDKLNAWTPQMSLEQADAIKRANADRAVGAIVMTGAGRGFCAGADIEQVFKARLAGADPGGNTAGGRGGLPEGLDWIRIVREAKPMVAAVNGAAIGIGVTMILPFDVIVASEAAKFSFGFIKMGLVPELASSHFLVSRIGFGRASELMLSARLIDGREAYERGLADFLASPAAVLDKALEIAQSFAANPDPQLRMTKSLLDRNACEQDMVSVQDREMDLLKACWETPEHKEAVAAFLEKRPARFR